MDIFLSWSKKRSLKVAIQFNEWLPMVIQTVEPFISPHIEKGIDPIDKIKEILKEYNYGIVCLTKENLEAPWIHFESGALSKFKKDARLWVFLLDVKPEDVTGPLASYQHTRFEREDVFKLLQSINQNNTIPLDEAVLRRCFDTSWPTFEKNLLSIKKEGLTEPEISRDNADMTSEILEIVRRQENDIDKIVQILNRISRSGLSSISHGMQPIRISTSGLTLPQNQPSISYDASGNPFTSMQSPSGYGAQQSVGGPLQPTQEFRQSVIDKREPSISYDASGNPFTSMQSPVGYGTQQVVGGSLQLDPVFRQSIIDKIQPSTGYAQSIIDRLQPSIGHGQSVVDKLQPVTGCAKSGLDDHKPIASKKVTKTKQIKKEK